MSDGADDGGSAGGDAALQHVRAAVQRRFVVDRAGWATLVVAAISYGIVRQGVGDSAALALATGLWCGYCVAHVSVQAAGRTAAVWAHASGAAVVAVVVLAASAAVGRAIEASLWPLPGARGVEQLVRYGWHLAFVAALIAWPVGRSVSEARRLARSEAQRELASARLLALQAQIEPHFLFNTLAALRSLLRRDANAAAALLDRMTEFLRAVLPEARQTSSTLAREVAIVEAYLAIMQSRLGERLRYRVDIEPRADEALLPPLLLQPLVENAIKHGIEPSETGGHVAVSAVLDAGTLVVRVHNTGERLGADVDEVDPGKPARARTGLANIRNRIAALYASGGSLTLASDADAATLATLRVPFQAGR